MSEVPASMRAVRLHGEHGAADLSLDDVETPTPGKGEALVRVHAAAITRDELTWSVDRLPLIPSYELSGVVVAVGPGVEGDLVGVAVYAITPFDRDGAAAGYVAVPADSLAPRPSTLDDVESASLPLAALSAWQGLFDHGKLEAGQRVVIHGAAGGVGHVATQLARWRGAHVIGTASAGGIDTARRYGAHEVLDADVPLDGLEPVDLVFDTTGGELLQRPPELLRPGGRLVSVAEEPPTGAGTEIESVYFVVEPNRDQLIEIARIADAGDLRPAVDSVFELADARAAFERLEERGKRGKVVLRVGV